MSKKKTNDQAQALKIGTRMRCTDDGVTGKVTWANGVSVKIKWDDGEQVTWKRDSLPTRPIEFLPEDNELEAVEQPAPAPSVAPCNTGGLVAETVSDTPTAPIADVANPGATPPADAPKPKRERKPKDPSAPKKVSAIDAAARVLVEEAKPMNTA